MSITAETITDRQVKILRHLAEKKWRTCEEWSEYSRKDVEPLVQAGLANYARGGFRSSRRGITAAGRDVLARVDGWVRSTEMMRAQSTDLLPLYQAPPERTAKPGELKGRMGFEFKKTVTIARTPGGKNALRAVHAAMLGAPFCDFTEEPIQKWEAVGHNWIAVDVTSIEEAAAAEVAGGLRNQVTCGGCLHVLSSTNRTLDRMLEIARTHA